MSDSVRPHRQQPTRLPHPWDSPGKNSGMGCHFLLQCMKVKSQSEVAQSCLTLRDPMDCSLQGFSIHGILQARVLEWGAIAFSNGLYSPWNSSGHSLLQGIFPTQGMNPGLLHDRQILYQLSHQGSPKSKMFLGKCHIALENMWVIFQYLLILIFNIILSGKRTDSAGFHTFRS